ncbi:MAG: DUF5597 domain-containing protein [Saprospiraceae bacterium]
MQLKSSLFIVFFLTLGSSIIYGQLPYLELSDHSTKLMVDGKPFIVLGGELHNSTCSDVAEMSKVWQEMKALNLNTVLAYAYWEMVEPEEGKYNFELIDAMLEGARKAQLKIILVWFGSWKSTASTYAPEWVKTNPERFKRYTLENGKTLEILSPFYEENRNADANAYVALMKHLKEVDVDHTVIMMQVENEPGCFENYRDYSPAALKAWASKMPDDMLNYLKARNGKLFPALEKAWSGQGYKTNGTWEEVLGKSTGEGEYKHYTEELFMAYHYSKYINYIAQKGREILDLPAFCNGWLYNPNGFYPHATVNPHVLDAYRAGGNALDFYAPNAYTLDYDKLFREYTFGGNILFIPESRLLAAGAIYSISAYNALGFGPFGINGAQMKSPENIGQLHLLKSTYKAISSMMGLITQHYGTDKMKGVYLNPVQETQELSLGDYKLTASSSRERGFSIDFGKSLEQAGKARMSFGPPPAGNEANVPKALPAGPFGPIPEDIGSAMVIQLAPDEFYVVGYGVKFHFDLKEGIPFQHLGFLSIDEGHFENDQFIPVKRWNGDEQKVSLPGDQITVLKIRLYRF